MMAFCLQTGDIVIRITGREQALLDQLRARYTRFIVEERADAYEVSLHFEPGIPPRVDSVPACGFDGPVLTFDDRFYTGLIDPARAASLRFSSPTPTNHADYFLRVVLSALAYQRGGLLLHAAGVIRDGQGFLFFGPSGSGKTTAARNSPSGSVINDDLVLLQPDGERWMLFGTPFTNPTQVAPVPGSAPAAALLKLVQSPHVFLEPLRGARAVAELIASVPVLNGSPTPPLDRCRDLLRAVPAYELHLRADNTFWDVLSGLPDAPA